jgi:molybdopterin molybdotransferase
VPVLGKSGLIKTLVRADGIVVVPMNKSGVYEGEEVEVRLFKD